MVNHPPIPESEKIVLGKVNLINSTDKLPESFGKMFYSDVIGRMFSKKDTNSVCSVEDFKEAVQEEGERILDSLKTLYGYEFQVYYLVPAKMFYCYPVPF